MPEEHLTAVARGLGTPYPYPLGWYAVAFSQDLKPGELLACDFMGHQIALWRQRPGGVRASAPYCPYLGNHLGVNEAVVGDELECKFHGWRFDGSGSCIFAPRGEPPRSIKKLRMYPVHEICGAILVYHDPDDEPPQWNVQPPTDHDSAAWRPLRTRTLQLDAHVQDVGENSVDLAHLEHLHRFDLSIEYPTTYDTVRAHTTYRVLRPVRRFPRLGRWLWAGATFDIHATGFGFNIGDIHGPPVLPRGLHQPTGAVR